MISSGPCRGAKNSAPSCHPADETAPRIDSAWRLAALQPPVEGAPIRTSP